MKAYFFCPCGFALRADGLFLGNFSGEACIDIAPSFIELMPYSSRPICFFLDNNLKTTSEIIIHKLYDGLFIETHPTRHASEDMLVLYQAHPTPNTLITVYKTDKTRIVIENSFSVESVTLPFDATNFSFELSDDKCFVCLEGKHKFLCVFSLAKKIDVLFAGLVEEYSISPVFHTKTRLFDFERTTIECDWIGNPLSQTNVKASRDMTLQKNSVVSVRRAFFERVLHKLSPEELLNENLKPHAEKLSSFLGDFIGVLPDFCTKKGIYLTYKGKDKHPCRLFDVTIENGFISNIEELES